MSGSVCIRGRMWKWNRSLRPASRSRCICQSCPGDIFSLSYCTLSRERAFLAASLKPPDFFYSLLVGVSVCVWPGVGDGKGSFGSSHFLLLTCRLPAWQHHYCKTELTSVILWGGRWLISLRVKGPVINSSRLKDQVTILHLDTIISNWIRGNRPWENAGCFTGSQLDSEMQPISVSNICNQPATVSQILCNTKHPK